MRKIPSFGQRRTQRRALIEAVALLLLCCVATLVISLLRPPPQTSLAHPDILGVILSASQTILTLFIFGYVLSRFFRQFKTGCAIAIILLFAYLVWAGRG